MIFTSNLGKFFQQRRSYLSLSVTDANSEKKWKGFFNSLSKSELEAQLDQYWKI